MKYFKFSPILSCVSLPRPTTSSVWNLLIFVWFWTKCLQIVMCEHTFVSQYQWFDQLVQHCIIVIQMFYWGVRSKMNWFQMALKSNTRPKKILLFTYMRGGSTFLGSLFEKNPNAIYWYEALGPLYKQFLQTREFSDNEVWFDTNNGFSLRFVSEVCIPTMHRPA